MSTGNTFETRECNRSESIGLQELSSDFGSDAASRFPPNDNCLHHQFLVNAHKFPDAVAIVCGDQQISYRTLASWATEVANILLKSGVQSEEIVAIEAIRSAETVAGMLAILQAQAAYLPIDPSLPNERMRFMLADAGVRHAIAKPESLLARNVKQVIDPAAISLAVQSPLPVEFKGTPEQLAYVLYTSGSTGEPKGVQIEHGGAMNTIRDINARFNVGSTDRVLALSSFCFDLSVFDLFGTLAVGGCVVLPTQEEARDPRAIFSLLQTRKVTIWNSVPALMEMLLSSLSDNEAPIKHHLRLVLLSGDWISLKLPERLWHRFPRAQLVSLGGATEVSIWSCFHEVNEVLPHWKSIPYGLPLAGQYFRILNAEGNVCNAGEVGELYIGGDGLARGYLNRPSLTDQRFVSDPFATETSSRLYRTGDLGRHAPDGMIEFLGRIDHQIKINGFRIEIGEIEAQLARHPEVQDAVVVARKGLAQNRLIAYIIPRPVSETKSTISETGLTISQVRDFLSQSLPEYMLPAAVVCVSQFVLSDNGKVDRSKLPEPPASGPRSDATPSSELERQVAKIFAEALRQKYIGIDDNFLELGGDSLTATSLALRLETRFGLRPVTSILPPDQMTPRAVARLLLEGHAPNVWNSIARLQPEGDDAPLFCFPGVDGHLLKFRPLAELLGRRQPVLGLQPPGLDGSQTYKTVEEIADYYVRLIRQVQPSGPYRLAGFSMGGIMAFEAARQLHDQGERIERLFLLDTRLGTAPKVSVFTRVSFHLNYLLSLPREELWPYLLKRCQVRWIQFLSLICRTPIEKNVVEFFQLAPNYVRAALANLHAVEKYVPRSYSGNAVLLRAVVRFDPKAQDGDDADLLGWNGLFQTGLQVCDVPGSHRDMLSPRNVPKLAETMRTFLATSEQRSDSYVN